MNPGTQLYLGDLPPRASESEVLAFLQAAIDLNISRRLVNAIFRGFDLMSGVRVQIVEKRSKRRHYRFAHITCYNAYVARFFIEALSGMRMRGYRLEAREYIHRANDYEGYVALSEAAQWSGFDRRASGNQKLGKPSSRLKDPPALRQ